MERLCESGSLPAGKQVSSHVNKKASHKHVKGFAHTEGLEPSTLGAEIRYSIQLNYVCLRCMNTPYLINSYATASLTLLAASLSTTAEVTFKSDSSIILAPSSAFVPWSLTIIGISIPPTL